jgi:transposase
MHDREMSGSGDIEAGEPPFIENGGRREYKEWFKVQVIEECHEPGASVSIVARRYNINSNVLFRWRRELQLGIIKAQPRPYQPKTFVPVGVISKDGKPEPEQRTAPVVVPVVQARARAMVKALPAPAMRPASTGKVELELSGRIKIRIEGEVNKDVLRGVLTVAREFA